MLALLRGSEKQNCHHRGSVTMSRKQRLSLEEKVKVIQEYLETGDRAISVAVHELRSRLDEPALCQHRGHHRQEGAVDFNLD